MKRKHGEILGELLEVVKKQNLLLEQVIKVQVLAHQVEKKKLDGITGIVKAWWGTDLKHHDEENNLIKKAFKPAPSIFGFVKTPAIFRPLLKRKQKV